jgi:hypothetical protein
LQSDKKAFSDYLADIKLKNYEKGMVNIMAKDSQLDPKNIRKMKSGGGPTMAESAMDGESRNSKKQSGNRHKSNDDKAKS